MSITADALFETRQLTNTVTLSPREINSLDINNTLYQKLISKIGNRCISDGIVNTETISILSRSLGELYNHDTTGGVHYLINYEAEVCSPKEGQVLKCTVDEHTDTQTICFIGNEESSPLEIYLSKQNYINNVDYSKLKKGDTILVRIVAYNIELGRTKIDCIGEYLKTL